MAIERLYNINILGYLSSKKNHRGFYERIYASQNFRRPPCAADVGVSKKEVLRVRTSHLFVADLRQVSVMDTSSKTFW
jgi:hypothetical protein